MIWLFFWGDFSNFTNRFLGGFYNSVPFLKLLFLKGVFVKSSAVTVGATGFRVTFIGCIMYKELIYKLMYKSYLSRIRDFTNF